MATIRKFGRLEQGSERPTEECDAKIVRLDIGGERYVQLNSYGTPNRKNVGARSQNMRLSREAFEQLVAIGNEHFNKSR